MNGNPGFWSVNTTAQFCSGLDCSWCMQIIEGENDPCCGYRHCLLQKSGGTASWKDHLDLNPDDWAVLPTRGRPQNSRTESEKSRDLSIDLQGEPAVAGAAEAEVK